MTYISYYIIENTVSRKSITKESYIVIVYGLRPVKLKITIALSLTLKKIERNESGSRGARIFVCKYIIQIILVRYYYMNLNERIYVHACNGQSSRVDVITISVVHCRVLFT